MDKKMVIQLILTRLVEEFELRQAAARRTREQGNNSESKAEGKYDTRATEENYLADGLARQAMDAAAAIQAIEKLPVRNFDSAEPIAIGALVEMRFSKETEFFLIASAGGGTEVKCENFLVIVLTPESPLGSRLIGRRAGEKIGELKIQAVY